MDLLPLIIFGSIIGTIFGLLDERKEVIGPLVLGIIGAMSGGVLANLILGINFAPGFSLSAFTVSFFGALSLLAFSFVLKPIKRR